jgi:hypothetical protein
MPLPNRYGTPIDPVPFVVVSGLGCMLSLSFGPLYGQAFGLSLSVALPAAVALSIAITAASFYWQVWDASPPAETAVAIRVERLFYGAVAFGVVLVALTLPFLLR